MIEGFITVAITFWLVIGVVLVANGYFVYQVRIARYRVMQTLADKGQPVPLELFNGPRRSAPVGMMRGGIVLVCIGVALMTFFWSMTDQIVLPRPDRKRELASDDRLLSVHDRHRAPAHGDVRTQPSAIAKGKRTWRNRHERQCAGRAGSGDARCRRVQPACAPAPVQGARAPAAPDARQPRRCRRPGAGDVPGSLARHRELSRRVRVFRPGFTASPIRGS